MTTQQLVENGDGSQAWRVFQHADDFALPDVGERISAAAPARSLLLRGKSGVLIKPIGGSRAKARFRAGHAKRIGFSELHEKPHLTIGDMWAGQKIDPPKGRPIIIPVATTVRRRLSALAVAFGVSPVGLRPPFVTPNATFSS